MLFIGLQQSCKCFHVVICHDKKFEAVPKEELAELVRTPDKQLFNGSFFVFYMLNLMYNSMTSGSISIDRVSNSRKRMKAWGRRPSDFTVWVFETLMKHEVRAFPKQKLGFYTVFVGTRNLFDSIYYCVLFAACFRVRVFVLRLVVCVLIAFWAYGLARNALCNRDCLSEWVRSE